LNPVQTALGRSTRAQAIPIAFTARITTSGYPSPSDEHIELNTAPSHWSSNLLFLIIAIGTEAGIANV